jgi:hypothetical protein
VIGSLFFWITIDSSHSLLLIIIILFLILIAFTMMILILLVIIVATIAMARRIIRAIFACARHYSNARIWRVAAAPMILITDAVIARN